MASARGPNIDDIDGIDDLGELVKLMEDLEIPTKGLKNFDEMREKVKEHLRGCQTDAGGCNPKEAFSVVFSAKNEDMRKREQFDQLYSQIKVCLDKMDKTALSVLNKNFGNRNVKDVIMEKQDRLKRQQYFVLVAGESSSGKSSFLNLLLGEQLLPSAVLSSTSTICELKYCPERKLMVHYKDVDPKTGRPTRHVPLCQSDESSYMDQISSYVHMKNDREKGSPIKKVEIFWPHELLMNGITVIDSPGIGESEIMDEMVENYLVNAFAFIYIISSTNAGGVQKDRIVKLLQGVKKNSDEQKERFPSKCALFVCNKWDTVPENEKQDVKEHVIKRLKRCWPELDPSSQIVYLSTKQAANVQAHGIITPDFRHLIGRMNEMIPAAINTRLHIHWEWLRYLLSRIIYQAKYFIHNADRGRHEVNEKMNATIVRIKQIEEDKDDAMRELLCHLNSQVQKTVDTLIDHLKSDDIQRKFSTWSDDEVVTNVQSWHVAQHEILKVLESRLRSFIEEWEEDNQVFAKTMASLKQRIVARWNLVEYQLRQMENDVIEDRNATIRLSKPSYSDPEFTAGEKFWIGVTSPIWLPVTIAVGALAVPLLGIIAIKDKVTDANKLKKYEKDRQGFLAEASIQYLKEMATQSNMLPFVKSQLDEATRYLHHMQARLPEIIEADRKLISQLEKETRSTEEICKFYKPIYEESFVIKGELELFGLNEIRRMDIDCQSLKKGDRLGEGAFGVVYGGKWKKSESVQIDVALKISSENINCYNVSAFLEEETFLRKLNHPFIVEFYGATLQRSGDIVKMVFVMELCQGSLRKYISVNPTKFPGKSPEPADLKKTIMWAINITNALDYMHKLGIVHRDLKPDNILVSKSNSVKIADVGAAKKEKEIVGTKAGTCFYMAPEVLASKMYDSAADIYSLGITMWEMWYSRLVFWECNKLSRGDLKRKIKEGLRPTHITTCQRPRERWQEVMTRCWAEDSSKRPTAAWCENILRSLLKDC